MNVLLCPDKGGRGLKAQRFPSRVPVLAESRQISDASSPRAGFPQAAHIGWGDQVPQTDPRRWPPLLGCRNRGGEEVHHCLKAWACQGGLGEAPEPHSAWPQPVTWAPSAAGPS